MGSQFCVVTKRVSHFKSMNKTYYRSFINDVTHILRCFTPFQTIKLLRNPGVVLLSQNLSTLPRGNDVIDGRPLTERLVQDGFELFPDQERVNANQVLSRLIDKQGKKSFFLMERKRLQIRQRKIKHFDPLGTYLWLFEIGELIIRYV